MKNAAGNHDHFELCRRCQDMVRRSEAIPASRYLDKSKARGWFCRRCYDQRITF